MKHFYAIYDNVGEEFVILLECQNDADAIRRFGMEARNENSMICRYKNEYDLYKIGDFDIKAGCYINEERPRLICHATRFREDKNGVPESEI